MEWLVGIAQGFSGKYPILATVLLYMGAFRLGFKPLFTFLHAVADAFPGEKDNQLLEKVEQHKIIKGLIYVLDWLASVKLINTSAQSK